MINLKNSKSFLISLSVFALVGAGCDTESNPLLGSPDASVTSITMSIPQIGTKGGEISQVFLRILDQNSNAVTSGYRLGNFSLLEGGKPGVPSNVGLVTEPLYVCMAIDRSGSMSGSRTTAANAAAVALVTAMDSMYSAAVVNFESSVELAQGFTSDKGALSAVINAGVASGGTALYDGTAFCSDTLQGISGRKMLLALGDGDDNASSLELEEIIAKINQNGQSAYMVGLGTGIDTSILDRIAADTGGQSYLSVSGTDLSSIFLSILASFENLTFLEYRRRTEGGVVVYMNFGTLTAQASKPFD